MIIIWNSFNHYLVKGLSLFKITIFPTKHVCHLTFQAIVVPHGMLNDTKFYEAKNYGRSSSFSKLSMSFNLLI
jgi:hypothetical protein